MKGATVRPAEPADVRCLVEIQALCPEAACLAEGDYLGMLKPGSPWKCLVAESEGRVLGLVVYQNAAGQVEILNLAVDSSRRREGIGRRLIAHLVKAHPGEAFLEVRESNEGALRFYQAMGFEVISRRKGYYRSPPEDAVVMRRGGERPAR